MDLVLGGGPARFPITKCRGFPEHGDIGGWFTNNAEAVDGCSGGGCGGGGGGGGSGSGGEEERQEAKDWKRRGAPEGHPAL